jgi:hypothetical protein
MFNLKINKEKTKVLACTRKKTVADVHLKGGRLEHVKSFTSLGRTITWDERSTSDI